MPLRSENAVENFCIEELVVSEGLPRVQQRCRSEWSVAHGELDVLLSEQPFQTARSRTGSVCRALPYQSHVARGPVRRRGAEHSIR